MDKRISRHFPCPDHGYTLMRESKESIEDLVNIEVNHNCIVEGCDFKPKIKHYEKGNKFGWEMSIEFMVTQTPNDEPQIVSFFTGIDL